MMKKIITLALASIICTEAVYPVFPAIVLGVPNAASRRMEKRQYLTSLGVAVNAQMTEVELDALEAALPVAVVAPVAQQMDHGGEADQVVNPVAVAGPSLIAQLRNCLGLGCKSQAAKYCTAAICLSCCVVYQQAYVTHNASPGTPPVSNGAKKMCTHCACVTAASTCVAVIMAMKKLKNN